MKKIKVLIVALFLCLGMATMGWCYIIDDSNSIYHGDNVGDIDPWIAIISKDDFKAIDFTVKENWQQETAWVNMELSSESATFCVKNEDVIYYDTNAAGVFAFPMETPPESEYFLLKNASWRALFQNVLEMNWGVFDPSLLPDETKGMNLNGYKISHVVRLDGTGGGTGTLPVPEPATMLLFGCGLIGLAGVTRKKLKK